MTSGLCALERKAEGTGQREGEEERGGRGSQGSGDKGEGAETRGRPGEGKAAETETTGSRGRQRETGRQRQGKREIRREQADRMRPKGDRREGGGERGDFKVWWAGRPQPGRRSLSGESCSQCSPGPQPSALGTGESYASSSWQALKGPLSWRGLARPPACSWPRVPAWFLSWFQR